MSDDNSRASEQQDGGFRVRWEVPLPWLISGMVLICAQAAIVYFGQIRQGELQQEQAIAIKELRLEQSASIKELTRQVRELSQIITINNVKDVEHDLKLADHDRRLTLIEGRYLRGMVSSEMSQRLGRN